MPHAHIPAPSASTIPPERAGIDTVEALLGGVLVVVASVSLVGMVLLDAGAFDAWLLAAVTVPTAGLLAAGGRRLWRADKTSLVPAGWPTWLAVGGLLVASILLFRPPADAYILGSDGSAYLGIGRFIGETGALDRADPVMAHVPAAALPDILAPTGDGALTYFPGALRVSPDGRVSAEFFHLTPVWMAAFIGWFGDGAAPYVNTLFGVLAVLLTWAAGRRLHSDWTGILAAGLLAVNVGEMWFARFPTSEMAAQGFMIASVASMLVAARTGSAAAAVLGALSAALATLARIDAFVIVAAPIMGSVVLQALADRQLGRARAWGLATGAAALGFSIWHAVVFAGPYLGRVLGTYAGSRLWRGGSIYLALLAAVVAAGVWTILRSPHGGRRLRGTAIAAGAALALIWIALAGSRIPDSPFLALVTPAGVAVAVVGLVLLVRSVDAFAGLPVAALFLVSALVFLPRVHDDTHWPTLLRRYVTVLLPMTSLLAAYALTRFARIGWRRWVAVAIALALGGAWLRQSALLVDSHPYAGTRQEIAALAEWIPPTAVTFFDAATPSHLALAARTGLGRASLLVSRTASDTGLGRVTAAAMAAGRPVRVVARSDAATARTVTQTAFFPWIVRPLAEVPITIPVLDWRQRGFMTTTDSTVGIYEVLDPDTPGLSSPAPPFVIEVGGLDFVSVLDGWHDIERADGRTWRWTNGDGHLRVPAFRPDDAGALELVCRVAAWRPAGIAPPVVTLLVDGEQLGTFTPAGADFDDYTVEIPPELAARLAAGVNLTLRSEVFVPADTGVSGDSRRLGVAVDEIEIRPTGSSGGEHLP